jgi:hypothetical protein
VAAWVLAVLSKEYAVLFPVLVGAEAWLTDQSSTRRRKLLFGTAGALILSAAYLWLRAHHMPLRPPGIDGDHIPLLFHAQYVLLTVGRYVERMILPWPQVLTIRPIYLEQGQVVLPTSDVVIGVLACLAFGIISVWSALRQRRLLVLLLCSFALFLPISNVVYSGLNSTTADRFFYFPMFGAALTVAAFARPLLGKARKVSLMVLAGGGVALFIGVAWVRTLDFVSEDTFWAQEAAVNPNNPVALIALAELAHRSGDRQLYRRHLLNAYSPASTKYLLVATATRSYVNILDDLLHTRPDGALRDLEAILALLVALDEGQHVPRGLVVEGISLDPPVEDQNHLVWLKAARPGLLVQATLTASRVGRDNLARSLARRVSDSETVPFSARYNLALALVRIGAYSEAAHQLDIARHVPSTDPTVQASQLDGLVSTMKVVRETRIRATGTTEPESSLLRAEAEFEVGGWLRAARILRRAHLAHPESANVWRAYVRALAQCRLDEEALDTARLRLDPGTAHGLLESLRAEMSGRTASAEPVPAGTKWWEEPDEN